jgi:hypothetical protein
MFHAQQYSTEDQEWSINWSSVVGCPTGATLLSSSWSPVSGTGMSFTDIGIEDEYFTTIRASGGESDGVYTFRNDVIVELDGVQETLEQRVEFWIVP